MSNSAMDPTSVAHFGPITCHTCGFFGYGAHSYDDCRSRVRNAALAEAMSAAPRAADGIRPLIQHRPLPLHTTSYGDVDAVGRPWPRVENCGCARCSNAPEG